MSFNGICICGIIAFSHIRGFVNVGKLDRCLGFCPLVAYGDEDGAAEFG